MSRPKRALIRRTVSRGMESPASGARSEKPASRRPATYEPASVFSATQLRPSSMGNSNPTSMLSVSCGNPRWGANTLL